MAPQIRSIPENGHLVVYQGEPASLGCDILAGSPTPEITWRRKVNFFCYLFVSLFECYLFVYLFACLKKVFKHFLIEK